MRKPINRIHPLKPRPVTGDEERTQRWVVTNQHDEDGSILRAIEIDQTGRVSVSGHDLGPGVQRALGRREYEFERTLSLEESSRLCELVGVGHPDDLLAALKQRYTSTHDFEEFLVDHGIAGEFWSRCGD